MQTLTIDIKDNFLQDILAIVEHHKDNIQIEPSEKFPLQEPIPRY